MATIEFWYEFASTYSYPAAMRIEREAERRQVSVSWQPFLLGPIFKEVGWSTSPFNIYKAKGRYMWRDLERTCAALDLPFVRPDPFPQNSLWATRLALVLPDDGTRADFSRRVYAAEFGQGRSIDDLELLRGILNKMAVSVDDVMARAQSQEIKSTLRTQVETAKKQGIFGAPSLVTGDGELFWGNDRLETALAWCAGTANLRERRDMVADS